MSSALISLVNKYWEDKGDLGTLARITDFLYREMEEAGTIRMTPERILNTKGEIRKLILEAKHKQVNQVNQVEMTSRERMKKKIKGLNNNIGEEALGEF